MRRIQGCFEDPTGINANSNDIRDKLLQTLLYLYPPVSKRFNTNTPGFPALPFTDAFYTGSFGQSLTIVRLTQQDTDKLYVELGHSSDRARLCLTAGLLIDERRRLTAAELHSADLLSYGHNRPVNDLHLVYRDGQMLIETDFTPKPNCGTPILFAETSMMFSALSTHGVTKCAEQLHDRGIGLPIDRLLQVALADISGNSAS